MLSITHNNTLRYSGEVVKYRVQVVFAAHFGVGQAGEVPGQKVSRLQNKKEGSQNSLTTAKPTQKQE